MLAEAATAVLLVLLRPQAVPAGAAWSGLLLAGGICLSTALLQAPRHRELGLGFDGCAHRFLVLSNRVRTALWSARGLFVLCMAGRFMA
jgi:hypothetical protein